MACEHRSALLIGIAATSSASRRVVARTVLAQRGSQQVKRDFVSGEPLEQAAAAADSDHAATMRMCAQRRMVRLCLLGRSRTER